MRCRYCRQEIRVEPKYFGNISAYIGDYTSSYCDKAPRGRNPLDSIRSGLGKWHLPDEGEYNVDKILEKYYNEM